jgi:hypothetical protein
LIFWLDLSALKASVIPTLEEQTLVRTIALMIGGTNHVVK